MDLVKLKAELDADPLSRGYSGMSDVEAATSLNDTVDRNVNKATMTASEVLNAVVPAEFNALTEAEQTRIWSLLGIGTLNPFGVEATLLTAAFGAGSATIVALAGLRKDTVSRATELGLGFVAPGHVENARY